MASLFNSLHIGYTGLNAAQVGISTTGHNISNAESAGYTRQRAVMVPATPLSMEYGNVGTGVDITDIKRVFDGFVYERYTDISAEKEYSDYETSTLEVLSTYFPEIDGVGIKADLTEYYNMWQTLADNPDNDAVKLSLAMQTKTLTENIAYTQNQVKDLQSQLNEQLSVNVAQVNAFSEQLADLNGSIAVAESSSGFTANDLRDQRNLLEHKLGDLIGADIHMGSDSYSISVNGFNIVDDSSYHPIHITNNDNANAFYELSFERQDGVLIPMGDEIDGGIIGSILDLRGSTLETTSGMPTDGVIQNVISQLDGFANGLIESTNNVYASSSTTRMNSNILDINDDSSIIGSSLYVKEGSFDLVVYDIDGNVASRRAINLDISTVMSGVAGSNSIQGQIEAQVDDNDDGNANNDVDDYISYNWATYQSGDNALEFSLDPLAESRGYTFSIEDNLVDEGFDSGSNFAGALGMSRYFDGDSAQTITLNSTLANHPTLISAGTTPLAGNNNVALNMVQHQYELFDFHVAEDTYNSTTYSMFDVIATEVGTQTNAAILRNETVTTQFNATELEYFSISKVSIDEEMTNLIKYQTSYGAAAKVITTVDQMMQTLLGIKS